MSKDSNALIQVVDHGVADAIKRLRDAGVHANVALLPTAKAHMLAAEGRAKLAAPRDNKRALVRGIDSDAEVVGNDRIVGRISAGGLASKYAEVQHENKEYAHTPEAYEKKYGRPLNRTSYMRGKRRFKRKRPITGYRGGHAHFIHGARDSAWNATAEERLKRAILADATQLFERAAGEGRAD